MAEVVIKPVYLIESLGEFGIAPPGAVLDVGNVAGPTFFVDGKPLIFADGTSTDGSGPIGFLKPGFQLVYENSDPATVLLEDKDIIFIGENEREIKFDAETGDILIGSNSLFNTAVNLAAHLSAGGIKHSATQISIVTGPGPISGSNVQEAVQSIANYLANLGSNPGGDGTVTGYEHLQMDPEIEWSITHNGNTKRVQVTIWDMDDELLFSDKVKIVDENTVLVSFNTPVSGRAILMLF